MTSETKAQNNTNPPDEFAQRSKLRSLVNERATLEERRDVLLLDAQGISLLDIARRLKITPHKVGLILTLFSGDPARLEVSPTEVILAAYLDHTDRAELVKRLSNWHYTFPEVVCYDGVTDSTWREVEVAVDRGLLTDDEFSAICAAVNPPGSGEPGWPEPSTNTDNQQAHYLAPRSQADIIEW